MQKKLILVLCVILVGLSFSCSEYILPKRVEVTGTVNLPVKIGVMDLGAQFMEIFQNAFSGDAQAGEARREVFNVAYKGQTVQAFCIYIPIEMTEDLNPNAFLETINKQINNGISTESRKIGPIQMIAPPRGQIPISSINLPVINPVYLDDIAKYVVDIKFDPCDGTVESGIGINFYLEEIIDGLEMVIECATLAFPSEPKLLRKGDNIFGSSGEVILDLDGYGNRSKSLRFNMRLRSADPNNRDMLNLNTAGLTPGEQFTVMKGEVRLFKNWTEARIDMEAAIKAVKKEDAFFGEIPDATDEAGGIDLSGLGDYLDGKFTFDGLETKMYMNNPVSFKMKMTLEPQYMGKESVGPLYEGEFSVEKEPFVLSAYLEDGNYTAEHLPGVDNEYNDDSVDKDAIADIFDKMPDNLTFMYKIEFTESYLTVIPEMFDDSDEYSTINMALMIMLPLRLVATTDGSVISIPGMFEKYGDLLGRNEVDEDGDLFESVKIKKIKMTVSFLNPIFSGGSLFVDGDKNNDPLLFYPNGIKLSGKQAVMDFTDSQVKIVQSNLIRPNLWIKLDKNDAITIPKNMGLIGVKIEVKGIFKTEGLLE